VDKKMISSPASEGSGVGISPDFRDKLGFRSSDVVFSLKLAVYFLLIIFGLVAINQGALLIKVVGTIILGVVFAHGVELQHQVLHNQGYRNRKINDFIGFILGLPMLVSYSHYKFKHLNHHRYLGTDKNEEFFDYGNQYGQHGVSALASWVLRLFMLPHYMVLVKNISSSLLGEKKFKKITGLGKDIWSDYRNMAF
jgi:fatty acid desaturase